MCSGPCSDVVAWLPGVVAVVAIVDFSLGGESGSGERGGATSTISNLSRVSLLGAVNCLYVFSFSFHGLVLRVGYFAVFLLLVIFCRSLRFFNFFVGDRGLAFLVLHGVCRGL